MSVAIDPLHDGHTHSHWCPHGSGDPLRAYLDRAVELGFRRYDVTEHLALPDGFRDPIGPRQCAMLPAEVPLYLADAEPLRAEFAGRLDVRVGFEVDYLGAAQGGWHQAMLELLGPAWDRIDPAATVLSVHFLDEGIVDGTPAMQAALLPAGANTDRVHLRYYAALKSAIQASWRWRGEDLRPRRLGHLTLPRKFVKVRPLEHPEQVAEAAMDVLELVAAEGLELDVNTAGLDKPDCGEIYLTSELYHRARQLGVTMVYGSDAHAPREVGRHRDRLAELVG